MSQMRHLEPILAGLIDVLTTCLAHGDGIDWNLYKYYIWNENYGSSVVRIEVCSDNINKHGNCNNRNLCKKFIWNKNLGYNVGWIKRCSDNNAYTNTISGMRIRGCLENVA